MASRSKLYFDTITPQLNEVLMRLMAEEKWFQPFRLVGGTALSLQRGHRQSVDIDLFTDSPYNSIDFKQIATFLRANFAYVDAGKVDVVGVGKTYFVGSSENDCIKLDLYYTEPFITQEYVVEGIRMATVEEIIAMKLDVVSRGGRKKDFWDLHELMGDFSLKEMIALHKRRYPFNHNGRNIKKQFLNFEVADEDFEPICLKGKYWEVIKLDMIDFVNS